MQSTTSICCPLGAVIDKNESYGLHCEGEQLSYLDQIDRPAMQLQQLLLLQPVLMVVYAHLHRCGLASQGAC